MNFPPPRWRPLLASRALHEFLWFCVPGVLVALLVRAWLLTALPYGLYHFDTPDFLQTPYDLLHGHRLTIHNKKTFLVPILFTIPFLLHVPALLLIPLAQHALGCLLVLLTGGLCRLWFAFWKCWIIPLTVLLALQPSLLWFEHTLLAETIYVFCVVWLALAGTLFARQPGWPTFGFMLAALFCTAGARPEGRLFLAFGVALTLLVYARSWRREASKFATLAGFCLVVLLLTRTAQGGTLLYASLLHLAPAQSRVAPDIGPCLENLRADARQTRAIGLPNDVVRVEKRLVAQITACYAPKHPESRLVGVNGPSSRQISALCLRLAFEIARQHPLELVHIVADRFLARIDDDSGGNFSQHELQTRQDHSIVRSAARNGFLGPGLAGVPLANAGDVSQFLAAHYPDARVRWYNRWEHAWMAALNRFRLPDSPYSSSYRLPGLPVFYLLAAAGGVLALALPGDYRGLQWAFLPVLAGVWFTVTLTGALMPRYRFVLEPFWLLYICSLADGVARLLRRFRPLPPP